MARSAWLKVALIERHELFADSLGVVLAMRRCELAKIPIPDVLGRPDRLVTQVLAARPAVAVVSADVRAHRMVIEELSRAGTPVVVLTDAVVEAQWGEYLVLGGRVVISKSEPLARIVSVIRLLGAGERVLDPAERERLIQLHRLRSSQRQHAVARLNRLTPHEVSVLRHLMAGRTVREIAAIRQVSEATVRTQVKSVLGKLEVGSQLSAVALAHSAGWHTQATAS